MTKLRMLINCITATFVALVVAVSSAGVGAAYADDGEQDKLIQELSGLTIDGRKFTAEDYPADSEGAPQVLYLNEVGYNYYANQQSTYGLVVYVYTPSQLNVTDDSRNQIEMKIGDAGYPKYKMKLLDGSADKLFYKFRVDFTAAEKSAALAALDRNERRYEISSIELFTEGFNATDYPIARAYTFKGYSAGNGEIDGAAGTLESTLSYTVAGSTVPIEIEAFHTSWRPEGTNGDNAWTQDTILSVYFAVPNEYDRKYDYLQSVTAEWTEALLAPVYVTTNAELAEALNDMYTYNLNKAVSDTAGFTEEELAAYSYGGISEYSCDYDKSFDWYTLTYPIEDAVFDPTSYHDLFFGNDESYSFVHGRDGKNIKRRLSDVSLFTYVQGGNTANDFAITSNELTALIRKRTEEINAAFPTSNNAVVADKYPALLFDSWNYEKTVKTIRTGNASEEEKDDETIITDDKLVLDSEKVNTGMWHKVFVGNQHKYEGIKAIQKIKPEDNVERKTPEQLSKDFYISERDAADFKSFYKYNKDNATVYLMRYATTDYWRQPANEYKKAWTAYWTKQSDGYFAQEKCFLDFDILTFDYVKNDEHYVLPVSMSPIDIFPEITPPPELYEKSGLWKYGLAVMGGLVVLWVVYGITEHAIKKRSKDNGA